MTENETIARFKSCQENVGNCEKCRFYSCCGIYDMEDLAIEALKEVQEYRKIGTVEECRAAVEQQIPKRPTLCKSDEQTTRYTADYRCPKCNGMFTGTGIANYCYHCGQRLDWEK